MLLLPVLVSGPANIRRSLIYAKSPVLQVLDFAYGLDYGFRHCKPDVIAPHFGAFPDLPVSCYMVEVKSHLSQSGYFYLVGTPDKQIRQYPVVLFQGAHYLHPEKPAAPCPSVVPSVLAAVAAEFLVRPAVDRGSAFLAQTSGAAFFLRDRICSRQGYRSSRIVFHIHILCVNVCISQIRAAKMPLNLMPAKQMWRNHRDVKKVFPFFYHLPVLSRLIKKGNLLKKQKNPQSAQLFPVTA